MKKTRSRKKLPLIIATIFFVIVGCVVIFVIGRGVYQRIVTCKNETCECDTGCACKNGKLVCSALPEKESLVSSTPIASLDEWTKDNLKFETSFESYTISQELKTAQLQTILSSISYKNSVLRVSLLQSQKCTVDKVVPTQAGFYKYINDELYLYNMINTYGTDYTELCQVKVVYEISQFEILNQEKFIIRFTDGADTISTIPVCFYNSRLYNNKDVYKSVDNCNICECSNGISSCTSSKVCMKSDSISSAYKDYSNYQRFEYPEEENECTSSSQCYIGGCQKEVCSAKSDLSTSCKDALYILSNVNCGCYDNKCQWQANQ